MKITKIRTTMGELHAPATVELDDIVERMRSETTKAMADTVARNAMAARLAEKEGMAHFVIEGVDRLPYLVFSATFKHGSLDELQSQTDLLLLTIDCPEGQRQVMEMKRRVQQVPYTLLAFGGVSGVTLKVVVRLAVDADLKSASQESGISNPLQRISNPLQRSAADYLDYLKDARESAFRIYGALTDCAFLTDELTLASGCRMSYDPQLVYQPQALPLPVIRTAADPLMPYEGTRVSDDGEVAWYPEYNERERLQLEYQACLSKALDDEGTNMERALQLLADYCRKARLGEEGCVMRTQWQARFREVGDDTIRKMFRNAYKKPYKGRTLSQMNEKERIMRSIEDFLSRRYQLRYNVVKQVVEYRKNDLTFKPWQPLGDRQLKSIVVEEMKEGGESWMNDIRTYIESEHVENYNPIHEFLKGCGEWDGKHNYIEDFARRLPTDYADWPRYFHRWFLALVAQALNRNRDYGNSVVPMLIGGQGIKKSTFCKNILPPSLREYYMDDIKMQNAEQVERVLGRMWLVCIDEYNAKTDREQAKIKRLLTEKDVQVRKMRSDQYTMTPRLCSFIATTNDLTPLPSGDGSRRYLCVEVTGPIDMSGHIPYRQLYAQAVAELQERDSLYWFTSEDEAAIQQHNRRYQQESSIEAVLQNLFEPAEHHKDNFLQVTDIQQELSNRLKASDVPNLTVLGTTLKRLHWTRHVVKGIRGYYLKRK